MPPVDALYVVDVFHFNKHNDMHLKPHDQYKKKDERTL